MIHSGGSINILSCSRCLYCWNLGFGQCIYTCVCVFGKFWTIGEGCQYTDKAGIFESLMSHRQWATASQAEMGRPELVSAWDSSWPPACNATLRANSWAVIGHVQSTASPWVWPLWDIWPQGMNLHSLFFTLPDGGKATTGCRGLLIWEVNVLGLRGRVLGVTGGGCRSWLLWEASRSFFCVSQCQCQAVSMESSGWPKLNSSVMMAAPLGKLSPSVLAVAPLGWCI